MNKALALLVTAVAVMLGGMMNQGMAGTPHTAYGKVFNSNGTVPASGDITFISYITSRPSEILTQSSPGCGYSSGYWQVQVGNFPTNWQAGDVLRTEVTNVTNNETGAVEVVMTNAGSDAAPDLYLEPVVPVELSSFSVLIRDGKVVLEWVTQTESNNFGFEIQRKNGDSEFATIGFVPGHGTTTNVHRYSFVDEKATSGCYYYRLKQMDFNGAFEFSEIKSIELGLPAMFVLKQNHPNPFNAETLIRYQIAFTHSIADVKLCIYNANGELVRTLVSERQPAGSYDVIWDGRDNAGNLVTSGIYIGRLVASNQISSIKMIYMK
ncbi:MAG: hypothetical protein ONB13_04550 [candidate division KSB1 bacterium]|nr:hypothetical protein [candidate division KSB1 bacterium]MDZ7335867.1 hypothetical protein [candidate division KSB1 bacterium]MDZ7357365.1 hypothetical protein [candidate division KSB1 bacterium]MDZ7375871.1 hypothetical protein [candidate division KSB1 bacterium]MDZ7398933.1 hypothetical protein [candidate division KSB1 bacterium]